MHLIHFLGVFTCDTCQYLLTLSTSRIGLMFIRLVSEDWTWLGGGGYVMMCACILIYLRKDTNRKAFLKGLNVSGTPYGYVI